MSATDSVVDEAIQGLDDDLQPTNTNDNHEDDPKAVVTDDPTTDKTADDGGEADPESPPSADSNEGYTIDQAESVEGDEDPATPEPDKTPEAPVQPSNLTPEQQFIFDSLPDIGVLGKDGKQYNVKVASQLPDDFEFANKRDELIFQQNLAAQELNARQLQGQYQSTQSANEAQAFEEKENASIRSDVNKLQEDGLMPKFKVPVNDAKFNDDPAAQLMQNVLDYMNERNKGYLEAAQKGGSYRHIGFEEAFELYSAKNPDQIKQKAQVKEDNERQKVAKEVGTGRGLTIAEIQKPIVKEGTTTRDVLAMIDSLPD